MSQKATKNAKIDYSKIGLKCGLELHQQLETGRKLFCNCSSELFVKKPKTTISRFMRPTLSEMGEFDKAALMEFKKKKKIIYEIPPTTCLYEIDEAPPLELDSNALDVALTIAKLLNMNILSELHVNRKQYLDGSTPNGFQRTLIIGFDGKVKVNGKSINLDMIALEEDSSREIDNKENEIIWRVDRLGIPLVEIATKTINIKNPEEIKEIAKYLGRVLRATGKVKRGLGTIRQDLNISIKKGSRVEIKGIQLLDMLPKYVSLEVKRQQALLKIKDEMKKREIKKQKFDLEPIECKEIFKKTKSKLLKEAIKKKSSIYGIKLVKMKGLLGTFIQGKRTFGKELADRVKVITGLGGLLHTDELPNYGITEAELKAINDFFDCGKQDAVIIVIGEEARILLAFNEIKERLKEALIKVPEETRHAHDDGTTSFRRLLGTASRMYPDTDSRPILISEDRLERIEAELPQLPADRKQRYITEYKLAEDIAESLAISQKADLFDSIMLLDVDPTLVAVTLEQTMKALTREEIPVEQISDTKIREIFEHLANKKIAKEAIEPLLRHFAQSPDDSIDKVLEEKGLELLTLEELKDIITKIIAENIEFIKENMEHAQGKIMGQVMEKARGKIDGKVVKNTVDELLTKKIEELNKDDKSDEDEEPKQIEA